MNQRKPLPSPLDELPFATSIALAAGVSRGRLRAYDLNAPFHGVRTTGPADSVFDLANALASRLASHQFFSHQTAAVLLGVPLPHRVGADRVLHLSAVLPELPPRHRGAVGHRLMAGTVETIEHRGLLIAAPGSTWVQLGGLLTVEELVIAGDFLVGGRHPLTTPDGLADALAGCRRAGGKRLRAALGQIRIGSESPRETSLRLLMARGGLPSPELNHQVFDAAGAFVARVDLAYPEYQVAVEYEGRIRAALTGF